jgi:hypothetical protein
MPQSSAASLPPIMATKREVADALAWTLSQRKPGMERLSDEVVKTPKRQSAVAALG